jgi:transcriptional/translational regulatory protein YebC/TACO1
MRKLNITEQTILARVLDGAIQDMSNNSCNDLEVVVTKENRNHLKKFLKDTAYDDDDAEQALTTLQETRAGAEVYVTDYAVLQLFRDLACPDVQSTAD